MQQRINNDFINSNFGFTFDDHLLFTYLLIKQLEIGFILPVQFTLVFFFRFFFCLIKIIILETKEVL